MEELGQEFVQSMKSKLDVELMGVASIQSSSSVELKERVGALLPKAKSVVVLGKEIYKEVVSLLKPSKETGEAKSWRTARRAFRLPQWSADPGSPRIGDSLSAKRLWVSAHAGGGALGPEVSNGPSLFQTCGSIGRSGYDRAS